MFSFSELLKEIRKEANISQEKFAEILWVSAILIAMLETWKRDPSKKFVNILANKLNVSSFSLMPFLSSDEVNDYDSLSFIEKKIYDIWVTLQQDLIKKKSKLLVL